MRAFVLIPLLFFISAPALAATCPDIGMPVYDVEINVGEPRLDFSYSREKMNAEFNNIPLPDPHIYHRELGAVMTAKVSADYNLNIRELTLENGQVCIGFDRVTVMLNVNPVIYLSSEFQKQECNFKSFLEHELKHVEMDRQIMQDYVPRIKDAMNFAFPDTIDHMKGPLPPSIGEDAKISIRENIDGAISAIFTQIMQVRVFRQQEIDTAEEYIGLARACPAAQ